MTTASEWETELANAFSLLLGRPIDDFDPSATYVLYHWDDEMSCDFFGEFDVEFVGSVLPVAPARGDFDPIVWGLDLARSVFVFDDDEVRHGHDLVGRDLDAEAPMAVLVRAHTDGSLFAAMRAATWTIGHGPEDLVALGPKAVVEPAWDGVLTKVGHAALRDHLRMLCLDAHSARAAGAYYSGTGECPSDLGLIAERPGHTFVTGWTFGEGQAASAIFQVRSAG